MSHFLVTGGLGFIGRHLVEILAQKGSVRVLDLKPRPRTWERGAEVEIIQGDVRDLRTCQKALEGIDSVFHLAAQISVPYSMENPADSAHHNVLGLVNVLQAARDTKVKKVVFTSSAAVYGNGLQVPTHEDDLTQPASPYGFEKLIGEQYCQFFSRVYGLSTSCVRLFNVYGAGQAVTGGYAAVVAQFMGQARQGEVLEIHGDGAQTRDFVYVGDVVRALIAASEQGRAGEVVNIGTGRQTSVADLARIIRGLVAKDPGEKRVDSRVGDIRHSCAAVEKAEKLLQFRASTDLQKGLSLMYEAYDEFEAVR